MRMFTIVKDGNGNDMKWNMWWFSVVQKKCLNWTHHVRHVSQSQRANRMAVILSSRNKLWMLPQIICQDQLLPRMCEFSMVTCIMQTFGMKPTLSLSPSPSLYPCSLDYRVTTSVCVSMCVFEIIRLERIPVCPPQYISRYLEYHLPALLS